MVRIRTKLRYFIGTGWGYYKFKSPPGQNIVDSTSAEDRCWDTVHDYPFVDADDLRIIKYVGDVGRFSIAWQSPTTPSTRGFINGIPAPVSWDSTDVWTFPTEAWKTEAYNAIQDTGPVVNLPLSIAELKDLPRTVRSLYSRELSVKRAADLHLTHQFGVSPLVGDVIALLNLQRSIAERVKRHRKKLRTHRARGALRTSAAYDWGATFPTDVTNTAGYGNLSLLLHFSQTRVPSSTQWYSAEIRPRFSLDETLATAVQNPTGLGQLSYETAWNLIPWSFLIDYFSNLGDVLEARSNVMLYDITKLCCMCTAKLQVTQVPVTKIHTWLTKQEHHVGVISSVEKRRFVFNNPGLGVVMTPLLSSAQVANIVALATSLTAKR